MMGRVAQRRRIPDPETSPPAPTPSPKVAATTPPPTSETTQPTGPDQTAWRERLNLAGGILGAIALVDAVAVTLYDVVFIRAHGGTGAVGQVNLSGFYSLVLLGGVVLLSIPAGGRMSVAAVRTLFTVAAVAAVYIAVTQAVEVYAVVAQSGATTPASTSERSLLLFTPLGDLTVTIVAGWLALLGFLAHRDGEGAEGSVNVIAFGATLAVIVAVVVQVSAASGTNSTYVPNPGPPPSTQVPLPVGLVSAPPLA